jgi:hypothetical protein
MSRILHLSAKDHDLSNVRGTVGLLCEFAADSPWIRGADTCYGPEELLGSVDAALHSVYPLVTKLLEGVPRPEGFPPLSIFEETLLEQLSYILQAFQLDRWISEGKFTMCRFGSYSPWLDRLREVQKITQSQYEIVAELPGFQSSAESRALKSLWTSRPGAQEFFRRVMPLWSRWMSGLSRRARNAPRGGIWFYSTAYNYTKIGLEYEPYLPQPMNYLVEDPATGGKRLRELGREWHPLYAWARLSDIPSPLTVRSMGKKFTAAISTLPLSETDSALRTVLLKSEWWHLFITRWLPFLIFNGRVLQRWYASVAPEMLVVGNAGDERVLLMHEDVKHIPVVMLQHGIMHWVYGVTDEPVDVFLLRGPFFQRCLNERLRRKTVILNFPQNPKPCVPNQLEKARDSILFITAPYDIPELFHPEDLRDILRSLLRVSHAVRRRLVIRVHPMDKISSYQQRVAELQQELGTIVEVGYSQGPGAEEALARSSVAVLYFSTMFLDCLRHGIPIVSFGWHWFPNKRRFEEERIFNFARDLQNFEALIRQGVEGTLPLRRAGLEQFLAQTEPGEISKFFREIWDRRGSLTHGTLHTLA